MVWNQKGELIGIPIKKELRKGIRGRLLEIEAPISFGIQEANGYIILDILNARGFRFYSIEMKPEEFKDLKETIDLFLLEMSASE